MHWQVSKITDGDKEPTTVHLEEDALYEAYPFLKDMLSNKGNLEVNKVEFFDATTNTDIAILKGDYHWERRMYMV